MSKIRISLVLMILLVISSLAGCNGGSINTESVKETEEKSALARARDSVETELASLQEETRELKSQFASSQAGTRAISIQALKIYPQFWNLEWSNNVLRTMVSDIYTRYFETHTYTPGEDDLYSMVMDIWDMLEGEDIITYIVYGNRSRQYESFNQCNDAWLLVYGRTTSYALDCETGTVRSQGRRGSYGEYWEGYIYTNPDNFRADLGRY